MAYAASVCGILSALNFLNKRAQRAPLVAVLATVMACTLAWLGGRQDAPPVQVDDGRALADLAELPPVLARDDEPAAEPSLIARPEVVTLERASDDELRAAIEQEPRAIGAIALGRPNRGALFNAHQLSTTDLRYKLEVPEHSFGTEETVRAIEAAITEVHRLFPNTPRLSIGHLSSRQGGWLRPHRSHQNGRDVDLGFYYTDGSPWYRKATSANLDVARTWALLSALERASGLEYAFVDQSLHQVLRQHAESLGESPEFIQHMFDGPLPVRGPTIRHTRGHLTHLHVRFASPIAVENAQRVRVLAGRVLGRKGVNNSATLAKLLEQRQRNKQRVVAERQAPKQRAKATGARTQVL